MSETYYFVCDDCKKRIWAGQNRYIYKYDDIADFLHEHLKHHIRFINANYMYDTESGKYEDVTNSNDR